MNENNAEKMLGGADDGALIQNVRFYQVVSVQCATNSIKNDSSLDDDIIPEISKDGQQQQLRRLAYIISPSTQLVLLSCTTTTTTTIDPINTMYDNSVVPKLNGYTARLPCITTTISFLRSISIAKMTKCYAHDLTRTDIVTTAAAAATTAAPTTTHHNSHKHPSVNDVIDALYLQSAIPSMKNSNRYNTGSITQDHTRVINVVGKEENLICHCIDEACNIMGMRSFHVDGLAAFWAQHNLFDAYNQRHHVISNTSSLPTTLSSQTLTGALPDKLRGIVVALDIALRSSPCVLHIAGIDRELSSIGSGGGGQSVDPDVRVEEERRILEVIRTVIGRDSSSNVVFQHNSSASDVAPRGGGRATCDTLLTNLLTPRIIIILSSTIPLPQGPLTSSFLQRSIVISPPDTNYARVLWDNNIDGTFDSLSSYLIGMSANEIVYMRQKFVHRWKKKEEEKNKEEFSPVSLLQSILADLEVMRSFTRSSRRGGGGGGGGSNLPLSSISLPNVRWEDVGGLETIRKEIMDAVELPLKYPTLFEGSRRSGILLFGPPGTGKTLVAKAVARECGLPFLSVKGPELLGSYVGESEANIRSVFEAARLAAINPPSSSSFDGAGSGYSGASVLFFDEFDSLAPRRGETGHGDGVMDRVVATLLSELDGASSAGISSSSKGQSTTPLVHVIVIAATNRPDLLDPSLLRPGRLDRLLYLGPAKSKEHCLKILLAQTRKFRFQDGCDAATVLEQAMDSFPPTLSGADLSAVASGALMRGLKRVCDTIEEEARNLNDEKNIGAGSSSSCVGDPAENIAVDVDDVMDSWSKDRLQPTLIAEDFIEAAKDIVPSISSTDLQHFENLQRQYSSC